ncbi:MAG: CHAP domain-containing protein [Pseudomonadota bacterium]|nr:CHAP domain-containing protein [Pseudomonadota bacterium]
MLLLALLGCAPSFHQVPGPLAGLGGEPSSEWVLPRSERPSRPRPDAPAERPAPVAIAEAAAGFVGQRSLLVDGEPYRQDCSGLVEAALASAGCAFRGSSAMLFEEAKAQRVLHRRRMPSPGDIAFFDDTYDRNGNGRRDDPLSHVAVVEAVDRDGTITLVHFGSKGVARVTMNLRHPEERTSPDGKELNDYLRAHHRGDPPRTRYLAGELWVAFASYWEARPADQVATAERSTR